MRTGVACIAAALLLLAGYAIGTWRAQAPSSSEALLTPRFRVVLPGVMGRMDHFGYDGKRGNLFVTALGNNTVEVVNNFRGVHTIRGFQHPQAALYINDYDRIVISDKGGKLRFYDAGSFALLKTLDFGEDADNLRYEQDEKRVYVGYGSGAIAMVDAARMERLPQEFALGSHPESFQFERQGSRIFVNLPGQESIGVIDRMSGTVTKWKIDDAKTNHALAFDEAGRRLFSAALHPGKLWVIDSDSGRIVTTLRIVLGVDDIWFDAARKRILASGHGGFITVIRQKDPDRYEVLGNVPTGIGGGTSFYFKGRTFEGMFVAVPNTPQGGSEVLLFAVND